MVKVGRIELTDAEALGMYFSGKRYIVAYRTVYALEWCANYTNPDGSHGGVYGREIYYHYGEMPLTRRGRWFAHTAAEVNKLIGKDILVA